MNEEIKETNEIPVFAWEPKTKGIWVLGHKFEGVDSIEQFIEFITNLQEENERLNNIINELEKTIEDYLEGCYCLEYDYDLTSMIDAYKMVLDKLKELKEGNNENNNKENN